MRLYDSGLYGGRLFSGQLFRGPSPAEVSEVHGRGRPGGRKEEPEFSIDEILSRWELQELRSRAPRDHEPAPADQEAVAPHDPDSVPGEATPFALPWPGRAAPPGQPWQESAASATEGQQSASDRAIRLGLEKERALREAVARHNEMAILMILAEAE